MRALPADDPGAGRGAAGDGAERLTDPGFPVAWGRWAARFEWHLVGGMAAAYITYFFTLCVLKYRAYSYGDYDLPLFDQAVWTTSHLQGFFACSIRFGHVFADHLPFILVGAVPFYWLLGWLVPGALILLLVQTAALGTAAIPMYLLARKELGRLLGIAVVVAYLLYPALGYMNLFEFHPGVLAVFFLTWTLYYFRARRWRRFLVFMILSLACREDVALPVIMLAPLALVSSWRRPRELANWSALRWVVVPCLTGAVYFLLAVRVIIPAFHPQVSGATTSPFVQLYSYLIDENEGEATAAKTMARMVTSPVECFRKAEARPNKKVGLYTWHLLAPTGGLSVLAPQVLVAALPTYYLNVLASRRESSTICYHYAANITPFIFVSLILGLEWLRRLAWVRRRSAVIAAYLLAASLVTSALWGKQFHPVWNPYGIERFHAGERSFYLHDWPSRVHRDDLAEAKDDLLGRMTALERERDEPAAVIASFDFLHRVPMRSALYSWHYVKAGYDPITGEVLLSDQQRALDGADFALLDFRDPVTFEDFTLGDSGELQRGFFGRGRWRVLEQRDSAVLLERGVGDGDVPGLARLVPGPGHVRANQPQLVPMPGGRDPGLRLVYSRLLPDVTDAGAGERPASAVLRIICQYALDERLPAGSVFPMSRLLAVFEVRGPSGVRYLRQWPLAYTLFHRADEWPRMRGADVAPASIRVTYPLLLPPGSPAGSYRVALSLRTHLLGVALASAELGSIDLE